MKLLFLDESGGHDLCIIEKDYPVFVLGGVIMDQSYVTPKLTTELNEFKIRLFGRTNIILHTADLTRNRNGFERLKDPAFRQHFYSLLNQFMQQADYKIIACVIKKSPLPHPSFTAKIDPYLLSLKLLTEQFYFAIGPRKQGTIIAEKRDPTLDQLLIKSWQEMKITGTPQIPGVYLSRRIPALELHAKSENLSGLQMADLIVSPIGRKIIGKKIREDFQIIERKFLRLKNGFLPNSGLIILSQEDGLAPATQLPTHD